MCQRCYLAVRPTGRECPTFIMLSLLMHQDRRPHTNCLPAMDSISWQLLNCGQKLSESQQSRPGTALKEHRHCIQVPKNIVRCCLIYKDGHNLRVLNRQLSSDRPGWLKYIEVQVEYTEEQPLAPSFQLAVQWLFNKTMNPESKDWSIEVLILSQPCSLSAETIWLLFVLSFLPQGAMPSWLQRGPASIGFSQHTLFF